MTLNVSAIIWTAAAFVLSFIIMTVIYRFSNRTLDVVNEGNESWDNIDDRKDVFRRTWKIVRAGFFGSWVIIVSVLLLFGTYVSHVSDQPDMGATAAEEKAQQHEPATREQIVEANEEALTVKEKTRDKEVKEDQEQSQKDYQKFLKEATSE